MLYFLSHLYVSILFFSILTMMDTSFNAFGAQGGWGGDASFTTQAPAQGGQQNANNEYANFRLPVTIATLQKIAPGEELLTIGNYKFGHVRLIGVIKEADLSDPSSATYKLTDINGDPDATFSVVHYLSLDVSSLYGNILETSMQFLGCHRLSDIYRRNECVYLWKNPCLR